MKKLIKWLAIGFVGILALGGCIAAVGGEDLDSSNDSSTQARDDGADPDAQASADAQRESQEDPSNSYPNAWGVVNDKWLIKKQPQIVDDGIGDYGSEFQVENIGDSTESAFLTVSLLRNGNVLGELDCTTPELAPGERGKADCFSADDYNDSWQQIRVKDAMAW